MKNYKCIIFIALTLLMLLGDLNVWANDNNESYITYQSSKSAEENNVVKELDNLEESDSKLVYVPTEVSDKLQLILKDLPSKFLTEDFNYLANAGKREVPTITDACALEGIKAALDYLSSKECKLEESQRNEIQINLEQYQTDIKNNEATIYVEKEQTRGLRKCRVYCKLLVRDFLETHDLSVTNTIRTRNILATGNACVNGNLLVRGNLKVEGQICGLTGVRGATGPTGPRGATGTCICPTGITGLDSCLLLPDGCPCLQLIQGVIRYTGGSVNTVEILEGSGFSAAAVNADTTCPTITCCFDDPMICDVPAVTSSIQTNNENLLAHEQIIARDANSVTFKIFLINYPELTEACTGTEPIITLSFATFCCSTGQ